MTQKNSKSGKKRPGITAEIMICFSAFVVITMILFWACQAFLPDIIYKKIRVGEIKDIAEKLISLEDRPSFPIDASGIAEENKVCAVIYSDSSGKSYNVSATNYSSCYVYNLTRNQLAELFSEAKSSGGSLLCSFSYDASESSYETRSFSFLSSKDEYGVLYVRAFDSSDGENCAVFVNTVISSVGATSQTILWCLLLLAVISLLLSVVLALVISGNIARPIVEISKAAKQLGKGDFGQKFAKKNRYREIDELAGTLEAASADLSKLESLQRELIANVSHDLRTPLTLISGYGEVMRDIPGEANAENCQVIIDEVARLTSLVNDMLEISKIQSGSFVPDFKAHDLKELLRYAVGTYGTLASAKGYDIEVEYGEEDYPVNADGTMLTEAIRNLVNNALTYTGSDGKVKISLCKNGEYARISVTDTGDGIAPEKLRFIWDRYYRDTEHVRPANGTGLGLSIVKSIMNLHGGRYGVKSRVGAGSTFWIELRLTDDE